MSFNFKYYSILSQLKFPFNEDNVLTIIDLSVSIDD